MSIKGKKKSVTVCACNGKEYEIETGWLSGGKLYCSPDHAPGKAMPFAFTPERFVCGQSAFSEGK